MNIRPMTVMHIDDNDDHALLVSEALSETWMESRIIRFAEAEPALNYLEQASLSTNSTESIVPDLILLDLQLPGMNGLEFLREVRNHQHTRAIPIVVLTNSEKEEEVKRAYRLGANSYIVKPLQIEDFVIRLAELNMYWFGTARVPCGECE